MHSSSSRIRTTRTAAPAPAPATLHGDAAGDRLGTAADAIRRAYFGEFAGLAGRYGVSLDDVFDHCDAAFDLDLLDTAALRRAAADRIAAHLDDVILAIACIGDHPRAWYDFESEYQMLLARMCELRVGEIEASLQAARFLRAVQDRTRRLDPELEEDDGTPALQEFTGLQPLRSFLGGPLFSMLQDLIRDGLVEAMRPGAEPGRRRLRLAD